MSYIVVDVESDGELLGLHSMVCFGAVVVREGLEDTFYGQIKPLTDTYKPKDERHGLKNQIHIKVIKHHTTC